MKNILTKIFSSDPEKVIPLEEIIFNVDNFNIWFCHPNNGATYSNKGIFLRLDKLSSSQIDEYLLKSYGITKDEPGFSKHIHELIYEFEQNIRIDWLNKLK